MFRILVATDGSANSNRAAEYAARLAEKIVDAELVILYVRDTRLQYIADVVPPGATFDDTEYLAHLDRLANAALAEAKKIVNKTGKEILVRTETGKPADVICNVANGEGFDLIIMGSRGLGEITGILMGSVSDRVMHCSKIPVAIVH